MKIMGVYKGYKIVIIPSGGFNIYDSDNPKELLVTRGIQAEAEVYIDNREARLAKGEIKKRKAIPVIVNGFGYGNGYSAGKSTGAKVKGGYGNGKIWVSVKGKRGTVSPSSIFENTEENRQTVREIQRTEEDIDLLKEVIEEMKSYLKHEAFEYLKGEEE